MQLIAEFWPIIAGIVVCGYYVVKLAIRNAVLEVVNGIQKDFSTKKECHECKEIVHRRIDKLQIDLNEHKKRKTTDTQKLRKIVYELKDSGLVNK